MIDLAPLESLYDAERGDELPLPAELATLYGRLSFPGHADRSYVIGNFVTTLDGVVSLSEPGHAGGGDISGFNQHDRMVMGLLRATADAVIVGAGTLRVDPRHRWTAEYIFPRLATAYQLLRDKLGKSEPPLNVIVTTHGEVDLNQTLFQSGEVPVLIVTTEHGLQQLEARGIPKAVQVATMRGDGALSAREVLEAAGEIRQSDLILVEGGPQLMGNFFAERCLDELFLTLAPQVAGRDDASGRPGLVAGKHFAPEHPRWGTLIGVKRGESHLFLRYSFDR